MAISTGNLVRSRNPGNAQSIIQSFLNSYLAPNNPNNGLLFYTGSYPTGSISDPTAKAAADAVYAGLGFFNSSSNQVTAGLTETAIANTAGQLITANSGVSYSYSASAAQGIPAGSFTGFSQIFVGELRRYLIYRSISATTTVSGDIAPAGTYTDSGKALINPSFAGDGTYTVGTDTSTVTGWNGGKINAANIANPSSSVNLVPNRVISASTSGTIGGAAATAFNTYWAALMTNWTTAYNNAGTVNLSTSICHGSCHSSCHGSRGRR